MKPNELDIAVISEAAEVEPSALWFFARNSSSRFRPQRKKRVKGKYRLIEAPYPEFKRVARRIHRLLQHEFPPHRSVHAAQKGDLA